MRLQKVPRSPRGGEWTVGEVDDHYSEQPVKRLFPRTCLTSTDISYDFCKGVEQREDWEVPGECGSG